MVWQDVVIAFVNIMFTVALIPSIVRKNKPHLYTSAMTFSGLAVITFVFYTLDLYFSAACTLAGTTAWFVLFVQSALNLRKNKHETTSI